MTLNIYKFNHIFHGAIYSLSFSLSSETEERIDEWSLSLDKIVRDEQLKTGSFKGKFQLDDDLRSLLGKMKEDGIIQPYYGPTSPRACIYTLQVTPNNCKIEVIHTVTEQKISIEEPISIHQYKLFGISNKQQPRFRIKRKEYKTLLKWEFWNPKDEFTSRYIYSFSPSSIGLGTTILDVYSNKTIDITDYIDW